MKSNMARPRDGVSGARRRRIVKRTQTRLSRAQQFSRKIPQSVNEALT
jgi:hypothetical protein